MGKMTRLLGGVGRKLKQSLKVHGVRETAAIVRQRAVGSVRARKLIVTPESELVRQRSFTFREKHIFSILVPLYNTPESFLREMIESVQAQTYSGWQLCMADGSDGAHGEVERICKEYAASDSRIKYKKLTENKGISGNTNACIELADGDFCALLDHDDTLHPSALFECARAVETGADFIYTDEIVYIGHVKNVFYTHFKPDFSPDTLRGHNYICHLSVFSRELLEGAGYFREECNGSQDYDLILRLTERAKRVTHIPQALYFWRYHSNSVTSGIGAKPYCITAAKKALSDHLERIGLAGTPEDSVTASTYRIRYATDRDETVSAVVYGSEDEVRRCVGDLLKNGDITEIITACGGAFADPRVKAIACDGALPHVLNTLASSAAGKYLLFLDAGARAVTPEWVNELKMFAQRSDVGAVSPELLTKNRIYSGGIVLGLNGGVGYALRGRDKSSFGYASRNCVAQNVSAVGAECFMVRRETFLDAGGFDEEFRLYFAVSLSLKLREKGLLNVFTPFARLSIARKKPTRADIARDNALLRERWGGCFDGGDPYYNRNLSLHGENFHIRKDGGKR